MASSFVTSSYLIYDSAARHKKFAIIRRRFLGGGYTKNTSYNTLAQREFFVNKKNCPISRCFNEAQSSFRI